jgi:hypothetical protein
MPPSVGRVRGIPLLKTREALDGYHILSDNHTRSFPKPPPHIVLLLTGRLPIVITHNHPTSEDIHSSGSSP